MRKGGKRGRDGRKREEDGRGGRVVPWPIYANSFNCRQLG